MVGGSIVDPTFVVTRSERMEFFDIRYGERSKIKDISSNLDIFFYDIASGTSNTYKLVSVYNKELQSLEDVVVSEGDGRYLFKALEPELQAKYTDIFGLYKGELPFPWLFVLARGLYHAMARGISKQAVAIAVRLLSGNNPYLINLFYGSIMIGLGMEMPDDMPDLMIGPVSEDLKDRQLLTMGLDDYDSWVIKVLEAYGLGTGMQGIHPKAKTVIGLVSSNKSLFNLMIEGGILKTVSVEKVSHAKTYILMRSLDGSYFKVYVGNTGILFSEKVASGDEIPEMYVELDDASGNKYMIKIDNSGVLFTETV
jgi:hypothetical protein